MSIAEGSRVDDAVRELTEAVVEAIPPTIPGVEVERAVRDLVEFIGDEAGARAEGDRARVEREEAKSGKA